MAWVAVDRAIRGAEEFGLPAQARSLAALRQRIHDSVCREGFSAEKRSFVQYLRRRCAGCEPAAAAAGRLPAARRSAHQGYRGRDPARIDVDGLVLRYRTHEGVDGLPPGEGVFLACSFWLADNLILQGRKREARALFERLVGLCNDVGLLAEEYDPRAGRQLSNFPQAFSHLALINTALNLHNHGPAHRRRSG